MVIASLPTLVLLPGMDGTGELFAPLLAAIGSQLKTQVVPYPCDQALGFAALLSVVKQTIPTDAPYVVLGESFSGPIAIALAALRPPQLKGVVLCCTFARNPRPALAALKHFLGLLPLTGATPFLLSALLLGRFATKPLREALRQAVAKVAPAVIRQRLREVLSVDVAAQLGAVDVPVIYLRGTRDWLVPAHAIEPIAARLAELRVINVDAPHALLQAAPESAAAILVSFLRQTSVST